MEKQKHKQINSMKILAIILLVLSIMLGATNITKQITIAKAVGEGKEIATEKAVIYNSSASQVYSDKLVLNIQATKANKTLEENEVVHEGEYIKWIIQVKNTTNSEIQNARIVANIPEGVKCGNLNYNYNEIRKPYFYSFDEELEEKVANIPVIRPGETQEFYYEVKVDDLQAAETSKEINTNISAYVGNELVQTYSMKNIVEPSNTRMFMGAFSEVGAKHYGLNINSDTEEEVEVKIHFPKEFELSHITYRDDKIENIDVVESLMGGGTIVYGKYDGTNALNFSISADNVLTAVLKTNSQYLFLGEINEEKIDKQQGVWGTILSAYSEIESMGIVSNEARIEIPFQNFEISMTSPNEGQEIKYGEEIEYDVTVKNIGVQTTGTQNVVDFIKLDLYDYLPDEVIPVSIIYDNYRMSGSGNVDLKKVTNLTETPYGKATDSEGNRIANVKLELLIPKGESLSIKIKAQAGVAYNKTTIKNMVTVKNEEGLEKASNIVEHTILPFNYVDPDKPVIPVEPTDPTDPTDPKDPTEPTNPTEPTDPKDPTEPTEPTDPKEPTKPTNPVNPVKPSDNNSTSKVCDLSIDKYVSRVVVTTASGTKEYNFNNEKLAKVEIRAKEMNGATVLIEYKMVVKNVGNVPASLKNIKDYLPKGLTFSSELNKTWVKGTNDTLVNNSEGNNLLQPEETKTLTLIATKQMKTNTDGTFTNKVELGDVTNSLGIVERNSENNSSQADVIISTSTGAMLYVGIIMGIIVVLMAVTVILVKNGKIDLKKISKTSLFAIIFSIVIISQMGVSMADWPVGYSFYFDSPYYHGWPGQQPTYNYWYVNLGSGIGYCQEHSILMPLAYVYTCHSVRVQSTVTLGTRTEGTVEKGTDNSNSVIPMKKVGNDYIYGPFTYSLVNVKETPRVEVMGRDENKNIVPVTNFTIVGDAEGNSGKTLSTAQDTFYIKVPYDSCKNGIASVKLTATGTAQTIRTVQEIYTGYFGTGGEQPVYVPNIRGKQKEIRDSNNMSIEIQWLNFRGALEITKVDQDNHAVVLPGVKFRIYGPTERNENIVLPVVTSDTRVLKLPSRTMEYNEEMTVIQNGIPQKQTNQIKESMSPYIVINLKSKTATIYDENTGAEIGKINNTDTGVTETNYEFTNLGDKIKANGDGTYTVTPNIENGVIVDPMTGQKIDPNKWLVIDPEGPRARLSVNTYEEFTENREIAPNFDLKTGTIWDGIDGEELGTIDKNTGKATVNMSTTKSLSISDNHQMIFSIYELIVIDDTDPENPKTALVTVEIRIDKDGNTEIAFAENVKQLYASKTDADGNTIIDDEKLAKLDEELERIKSELQINKDGNIIYLPKKIYPQLVQSSLGATAGGGEVEQDIEEMAVVIDLDNKVIYKDSVAANNKIADYKVTYDSNGDIESAKLVYDAEETKEVTFNIDEQGYITIGGEKLNLTTGEVIDKSNRVTNPTVEREEQEESNTIVDDNKNNGYDIDGVYETDQNGKIQFDNLTPGLYHIREIGIEEYGYAIKEDGDTIRIDSGEIGNPEVEDEKKTGNLDIWKQDETTGKAMEDIGFKIRSLDGDIHGDHKGEYIKVPGLGADEKNRVIGVYRLNGLEYTNDINEATEFITDSQGHTGAYNIIIGRYEVIESSIGRGDDDYINPYYHYYEIDDNYITWEYLNSETSDGKTEMKPVNAGSGKSVTVDVTRRVSFHTDDANEENATFSTRMIMKNRRKLVDIEGFVWEDRIIGKGSERDDRYVANTSGRKEDGDMLVANVTVALVEGLDENVVQIRGENTSEKVAAITKTDANGRYQFRHVEIDKLKDYYIMFEYNGMSYQVVASRDDDQTQETNKAADWYGIKGSKEWGDRSKFENRYETITNNNANGTQLSGQNGNLKIEYDQGDHESILNFEGDYQYGYEGQTYPINGVANKYLIQSATNWLSVLRKPEDIRENSETAITNLNLGVYERERPDLFVTNDTKNTRLSIRGYDHVYEYENRFATRGNRLIDEDGTDNRSDFFKEVGVKFGQKYGAAYTQPIYRADYSYEGSNESEELKVYLTYQIGLANQSTNVTTRVNSIVDYFDVDYRVNAVGTEVDQSGIVSGGLQYREEDYNNQFKRLVINTDATLNPQEEKILYIQFELTRAKVAEICKDVQVGQEARNLNNVAEILSYSSTKDGNIYAGIDKHSNPGNAVPGDVSTYENDTDKAPDIRLKVAEERNTTGTVFLDSTPDALREGQERLGDGVYNDGEAVIPGMTVQVIDKKTNSVARIFNESNKQWEDAVATSDGSGNYIISGLTPSEYEVQYIWKNGLTATDGTNITVQDFKGTIYQPSRDQNDKYWYKKEVETRYTDAIDNWQARIEVDEELTTIKHDTKGNLTKDEMISATPEMDIKIEYTEENVTKFGETILNHNIENVDFGLAERPRQDIELIKKVSKVSFKLANGQTVSETVMNDDGTMQGNNLVHMQADPNANPRSGIIKIEMDNELMQGAKLEIEYKLQLINRSEVDYRSEGYYKYGTNKVNIVTLTPSKIIDYLDTNVAFNVDDDRNNRWTQKTRDDLESENLVAEKVYKNTGILGIGAETDIKNKKILVTEALNTIKLVPGLPSTEEAEINSGKRANIEPALYVTKDVTSAKEVFVTGNEAEIIEISKDWGRNLEDSTTPGNYIPGKMYEEGGVNEPDDDISEQISVTPTTGANRNYILPISVGAITLLILGAGVILIKKKVL